MSVAEDRIRNQIKDCTNPDKVLGPDWNAFMSIVDQLNNNRMLNRQAAITIRRQMTEKTVQHTLLCIPLLEAVMKNCPAFHRYANEPEFLSALVSETEKRPKKSIIKAFKNAPEPSQREIVEKQEKILVMIEAWGKAFENSQTYTNFYRTFKQMKDSGVRFPQPLADEAAPIFTPPPVQKQMKLSDGDAPQPAPELRNTELRHIMENCKVLRDMINASEVNEDLQRNDLVQEFLMMARESQKFVMQKVSENPSEALMHELLQTNDTVLSVIEYYEGILSGKVKRQPVIVNVPKEEEKKIEEPIENKPQEDDNEDILGVGNPPPYSEIKKNGEIKKKPPPDMAEFQIKPPPASVKQIRKASNPDNDVNMMSKMDKAKKVPPASVQPSSGDDLLDFLSMSQPIKKPANSQPAPVQDFDLLDLLGDAPAPKPPRQGAPRSSSQPVQEFNPFNDDFNPVQKSPPRQVPMASVPSGQLSDDMFMEAPNSVKKKAPKTKKIEEDLDDFMAIGMRSNVPPSGKPAAQSQRASNPFDM